MSDDALETPAIEVAIREDRTAEARCDRGFLRVRRLILQNRYPGGRESAPYAYDVVERDAVDAVVMLLHTGGEGEGEPKVCLRSSLRPPLALRPGYRLPLPARGGNVLWELPAGLVEADERGVDGLRRSAARETLEETGLDVEPPSFELLGPPVYLTPGVIAEQVHFLAARVDPSLRGVPTEDGSPVEENAVIRFLPIAEALAACADGRIADSKTELGLRRLAERCADAARPTRAEALAGRRP
jgi:ADP-ribose pyrophosphatase